jgi:tetratricopeptide (TPR) repeat protein
MVLSTQQPISHSETPPPPRPEVKTTQSQVKAPDLIEIARLQMGFVSAQSNLDRSKVVLKIAQAVKAGHSMKIDSPEYQHITKRQQAGETIDDIISKLAANVKSFHGVSLDRELPYREAEASLLRSEVGSPITDQDILRIVNGFEKHYALKLNDPALVEVNRRRQAGESLLGIKAQAQQAIDQRERTLKTLLAAEAMKQPQNTQLIDLDIEASIKNRIQAGESLNDIISKTKANLDGYTEIDKKKGQLAQIERRIEEINNEKQALENTKQKEQELTSQRELQQIRQQLESMQKSVESSPELSPEIIANFKQNIFHGGQLIKEGKYTEAMEYFRNAGKLKKVGKYISPARSIIIHELPKPDEYDSLVDSVAKNSRNTENGIELSRIDYYITGPDGVVQKQNQALPQQLQHDISLVYMEEWLHSLQNIQGKPLTGEPDPEIDVAVYMEKNGIPMTEAFKRRYGRNDALNKAKQAKNS